MSQKEQNENILFIENILYEIPVSVYWMNKDFIYLGCSNSMAELLNLSSRKDIVGKTYHDLYEEKSAECYRKADTEVMTRGIPLTVEEPLYMPDGTKKMYLSKKVPLHSSDGNIIGMLGISVDITDIKKLEHELKQAKEKAETAIKAKIKAEKEKIKTAAKNAEQKAHMEIHEEYRKDASQLIHDINSPLGVIKAILAHCKEVIPEQERLALSRANDRSLDILSHFLKKFRLKDASPHENKTHQQVILLSAVLYEVITDKKEEYFGKGLNFEYKVAEAGQFVFIKVDPTAFTRMLSNLINNAVEAIEEKKGCITLQLDATSEKAIIKICDDGKGMPQDVIDKITKGIAVTKGKVKGSGLGFSHTRDTLRESHGNFLIDSKPGEGTEITLTFPKAAAPAWIAEKIIIGDQDLIVILDDDPSIHDAWDIRFTALLKEKPKLQIRHFEMGQECCDFLQSLSKDEKQRVFFLSDYELLRQNMNGIDVITQSKMHRAILVTSHYAEIPLQKEALKLGIKILPKALAGEIDIQVINTSEDNASVLVDAVWLEDDQNFTKTIGLMLKKKSIDFYHNPDDLMKNIGKYPKDTRILLDNQFDEPFSKIRGVDIASELHHLGYSHLILISGGQFKPGEIPEYIRIVSKLNISDIEKHW